MKAYRWLIIAAILLAAVLLIVYGFLPKPVEADLAQVKRSPLTVTVEEEGKTAVKDRFTVTAAVGGYMRRITLEVGDPVRQGQELAALEPYRSEVLDPRSRAAAEAGVSAAQAALKGAQDSSRAAGADFGLAKTNFERAKKLFETGYTAKSAFDQAKSEYDRSEATLRSAEAAVIRAKAELERARTALGYSAEPGPKNAKTVPVLSPASGRVLKLYRKSEGNVRSGEALLDIGDPENLEVRADVLTTEAVNIKPGSRVIFERWGGGAPLEGRVRRIEPAGFTKVSSLGVEEQRTTVVSDFTTRDGAIKELGDGFRVITTYITWEGADVLQLPASALVRKGAGWTVFTVEGGRAHQKDVIIGRRSTQNTEIISGVNPGDTVITHPDETIKEGVKVRPRSSK